MNIKVLREKLPTMEDLYMASSKLFYLPEITSRAVSNEWLVSLHILNTNTYCPSATTIRYTYKWQGRGASELLIILEKEIKKIVGATKTTNFSAKKIPNINWIKDTLLHLWKGADKLGFLLDEPINFKYSAAERQILSSTGSISLSTR